MGFLSPALLAGAALIAVPVILHLVMRRQSRQITFPALRFVQQRRESNRRRLQLRHLLLLALRCLLVAGLAVALARPTLKGSGLRGKEGAPLAVAVVVDNSLRMQYVHQNRSRLEEATDAASDLVQKLPEDSHVAVCDLGRASGGFAPDLSAAASRLRNLRTTADARRLTDVIVDAVALLAEQDDRRQELFVFSDLTAAAWPADGLAAIKEALAEAPDVRIYVFDAGVESPHNASLGELAIRRSSLRPGEPLHIEAPVTSNLKGERPLVELHLTSEDGKLEKRGQQIADLNEEGKGRATFDIADLPLGTHQGSLELTAADPLQVDNSRYFTVEVRPPARVLLLAERPADARFVNEALSPTQFEDANRFECEVRTFGAAGEQTLENFQTVLLLDPPSLSDELWKRLWDYASDGGGVGIFLGHNADFHSFNEETPQRLLPGKLKRISREETYVRPRRLDHPSLVALRDYAEAIPWPSCKVFRFWQLDEESADTYVVAAYANGKPAILERPAGRGRILVATTPFSDPPEPEGRETWNLLPIEPWPFVALCDQLVGYLTQDGAGRLDYLAGETARIKLGRDEQVASYVLRLPDGQAASRVAAGDGELAVGVTDLVGNYRLTAGGRGAKLDRGFSVNAAADVSELARLDPAAIGESLPKDRVQLADDLASVEKYVDIGRSGRELYPWVIALVALVWSAEHVLANRFYKAIPTSNKEKD
jgi:hypothetical protein